MSGVVVVEEAAPAEQAEVAAEAAVEVAAIEAERDVAVAAIEAETHVAAIEAAEVHHEWRTELETLRAEHATHVDALSERINLHETQIANLTETVAIQAATIEALSSPPQPSPEPEPGMEPPESGADGLPESPEESATRTEHTARRKRKWL